MYHTTVLGLLMWQCGLDHLVMPTVDSTDCEETRWRGFVGGVGERTVLYVGHCRVVCVCVCVCVCLIQHVYCTCIRCIVNGTHCKAL